MSTDYTWLSDSIPWALQLTTMAWTSDKTVQELTYDENANSEVAAVTTVVSFVYTADLNLARDVISLHAFSVSDSVK